MNLHKVHMIYFLMYLCLKTVRQDALFQMTIIRIFVHSSIFLASQKDSFLGLGTSSFQKLFKRSWGPV